MNKTHGELEKTLSLWDSIVIIIAIVVGVGIFRVPAEIAKYLNSPILILFAWLLGGVISLLGAFCYAELSSSFPRTGGNYIYLKESYGPGVGFLFGWTELLVIRTGSIAAVAFICAEYLQSLLSLQSYSVKMTAILIICALSFINIIGLRHVTKTQNIFTFVKIAVFASIIMCALLSGKGNIGHFYSDPVPLNANILSLMGLAQIPILWTYGGWHENTFVAGETKNAKTVLPMALIIGISLVTLLYLIMNSVYIYLMPVQKIAASDTIIADVLKIALNMNYDKIFEVIVIIFSLGCINAMITTGSRVTYAMAHDNRIFGYMTKISPKYGTPYRSIIINGGWSILLIMWGTFNKLLFFTGILVWLFFALVAAALFILRRKFPDIERPHMVWGYPFVPIIFILVCAALFINTLIFYKTPSLIGLGLLASGIPVYYISKRKGEKSEKNS